MKTILLKAILIISFIYTSQVKAQDNWFNDCYLPAGMVVYGNDLYYVDAQNRSSTDGSLSKIDLSAAVPTKIELISGLWNPRELLIEGDNLYILRANGEVFSVDLTQTTLSTTLLTNVTGNNAFNTRSIHIAIHNNYIYASLLDQNKIVRFSLDDPTLQEDVVTGLEFPKDLDFIGDVMYYSDHINNNNGARLYKLDTSYPTATPIIVVNALSGLSSFTTSGTDIYCLMQNHINKIDTTDTLPTNNQTLITSFSITPENILINGEDFYASVFFEGYGTIHKFTDNSLSTQENIEENKINDIKIYPNPATTLINISSQNNEALQKVAIFNLLGKQVLQRSFNNELKVEINSNDLSKGIYLVKVHSEGKLFVKKVVIN